MQKILALAGSKQSGKSSCCNFLHGYLMKIHGCIDQFDLTNEGKLIVNSFIENEKGETEDAMGLLEVERDDYEFVWKALLQVPFYYNTIPDILQNKNYNNIQILWR